MSLKREPLYSESESKVITFTGPKKKKIRATVINRDHESFKHLNYLLETYFHCAKAQSSDEIIEAIWDMHEIKMQLNLLFLQSLSNDERIPNLHQLKAQLAQLKQSIDGLLSNHPLSYFLAMIVKETELLLVSKNVQG